MSDWIGSLDFFLLLGLLAMTIRAGLSIGTFVVTPLFLFLPVELRAVPMQADSPEDLVKDVLELLNER